MTQSSFPILREIDDIDLSNLKISQINSLAHFQDFETLVQKIKREQVFTYINLDIDNTELESKSTFGDKISYVFLNRIPVLVALAVISISLVENPLNLFTFLVFPISAFLAGITYPLRYVLYALLLTTSFFTSILYPSWIINLNVSAFLLILIWRHYRDQLKIKTVLRRVLMSETDFLSYYLSNRIIVTNTDKVFNSLEETREVIKTYFEEHPKELAMEDKLFFCKQCKNKSFNKFLGVVCGLTDRRPEFKTVCKDYSLHKGFELKESQKLERREQWGRDAVFSTKASFVLTDILIIGICASTILYLIDGSYIPFLHSGLVYYLPKRHPDISEITYFSLPLLIFVLGILTRLKFKETLLIIAALVGIDAAFLILHSDYIFEPHIRFGIAGLIGTGYFNIENAKIYSRNLPSSNAFLRFYFFQEKIAD